jgi:hypothetical protein
MGFFLAEGRISKTNEAAASDGLLFADGIFPGRCKKGLYQWLADCCTATIVEEQLAN